MPPSSYQMTEDYTKQLYDDDDDNDDNNLQSVKKTEDYTKHLYHDVNMSIVPQDFHVIYRFKNTHL